MSNLYVKYQMKSLMDMQLTLDDGPERLYLMKRRICWNKMLAIAVANSFAASLLLRKEVLVCEHVVDGVEPWIADILSETRFETLAASDPN